MFNSRFRDGFVARFLVFLLFVSTVLADIQYVAATINGQEFLVKDNRKPSLFTGNYGDCMSDSPINVTRFDAAFYKDNMTVVFHLGGDSSLKNESIMMYIGVYAYGTSRFDLTFNPCNANIWSACPIQEQTPIEAQGVIPLNQNDIAGIPDLAFSIPDFEGEAILRIFSNATESQIGCFAAVITNGSSFHQPAAVGSILGILTFVALISSFATAIYGDNITVMRKHYAHSLSVLVVFAAWQHIFFSGAISVNWPSVLVAFWSNYAWAGGMMYTKSMQNSISSFVGSNKGNTSQVGASGTGDDNPGIGGGYDIRKIYKRELFLDGIDIPELVRRSEDNPLARRVEEILEKRRLADSSDGFSYYGQAVQPGLPLPGNFSGFAGIIGQENIPASNAFMTGFIWFLVLVVAVAASIIALKFALEALSRTGRIKSNRLLFFRTHYLGYTATAVLRTLFIGFFAMMFLTLFQFSYHDAAGPIGIASVVFVTMLVLVGGLAGYACFYRIRHGDYVSEPDRLNFERKTILKIIPWFSCSRQSSHPWSEDKAYMGSIPWWRVSAASDEKSIHYDEDYVKKFGWLASRFRRTRWWFFAVWLVYEFIRACFLAGGSGSPMAQVFGLLVVEFVAFTGLIMLRPFEGQRLNIIVVYVLGFSKIVTVALSAAFDTRFNLPRIPATAIGIVIIVIQGVLTIVVMIAIVAGAISSYMSVLRNREAIKPKRWNPMRIRYLDHMDFREKDIPRPPVIMSDPELEVPRRPYFSVKGVKRMAKVEDEDAEFMKEIYSDASTSQSSFPSKRDEASSCLSGAASLHSQTSQTNLPRGARVHRPSWSTNSFSELQRSQRRRTRDSSMYYTAESPARPASRPVSQFNTRFVESLDNVAQSSPHSAGWPATPIPHPNEVGVMSARPRSRVSANSASPRLHARGFIGEGGLSSSSRTSIFKDDTNSDSTRDTRA